MGRLWLSALGADRPGIVAAVSSVLVDLGCNLEDSTMTNLQGHFAVLLVVSAPDGLTAAALEYARDNIRVNAVYPGYIETPMTRDTMQRRGEQLMAMVPMRRLGRPEEIAEAVVWLCSDRAAFVTGAAYSIDGGYSAI